MTKSRLSASLAVVSWLCSGSATATVRVWSEPDLDWLAYVNASGPGNRAFGPSWIGGLEIDEQTGLFVPKGKQEPSRLGMALVAFDTSSEVTPGRLPSQYQVDRVTLTMTMASATFPGATLHYDDAPDAQAEILADIRNKDFDSQRPMELYGVGFRDGYTGFEFTTPAGDSPPPDETLLDEATHLYASTDGGYLAYPIASDAAGQPVDVSNSITGGFSETAPGNHAAPFDPVPWAIGSTDLPVGAAIPDDTTFTFDLNLAEPGVLGYVQQGLADGGLGFFVSSLTLATQPGLGVFPYPQWYLKESAGGAVSGIPPTLAIDVTALATPGDFDGDMDVDGADLQKWQQHFGVDGGANADGDEDSDGADFLIWQRNVTAPEASVASVPEPVAIRLLALLVMLATLSRSARAANDIREVKP